MKKILFMFAMLLSVVAFTGCSDDEDPKAKQPTNKDFLNVPPLSQQTYDLKTAGTVQLTCSQPNYGVGTNPTLHSAGVAERGLLDGANRPRMSMTRRLPQLIASFPTQLPTPLSRCRARISPTVSAPSSATRTSASMRDAPLTAARSICASVLTSRSSTANLPNITQSSPIR